MKTPKLPESYLELKKLSLVIEDICKDIELKGFGFEPDVLFGSSDGYYYLDLPKWFLIRLNNYVNKIKDNL